MPKIYATGPTALPPFRRKSYSGFLRSEKIHQPRPGLNPRTSDTVASMITTGPPGATHVAQHYVTISTPVISSLSVPNMRISIFSLVSAFSQKNKTYKYLEPFLIFPPTPKIKGSSHEKKTKNLDFLKNC